MKALLRLLAKFVAWLNRKAYESGYREGYAAAQKDQREAAEALREDYDEISNDGRSLDDALNRMRDRSRNGRRLPKP